MQKEQIESWIINKLSELKNKDPQAFHLETSFNKLGVDSTTVFVLCGELESWLGIDIHPNLIRKNNTIALLAQALSDKLELATKTRT